MACWLYGIGKVTQFARVSSPKGHFLAYEALGIPRTPHSTITSVSPAHQGQTKGWSRASEQNSLLSQLCQQLPKSMSLNFSMHKFLCGSP